LNGYEVPGFKLGKPSADCVSTCERYGLECTEEGLKANNHLVDQSKEILAIIAKEEGEFFDSKGNKINKCQKKKSPGPATPTFSHKEDKCVLPPPEDSIVPSCTAQPLPKDQKKRRICWCEMIDHLCEPNPCMNGGECSKGVCTCPKGYKGDKCQIDELCPTDTCKNFSHCSQGVCTCAKGWTGTNCEIHENCSPNPCQNGGVCDYGVCTCDKGWLGNHCEKDALCDPNPCLNGGECSKGVCSCTKGNFMGGRCEIDVLCSTNPCLNGAQCSQGECSCPPGWTGGRCEHLALVNGGCYEDNGSRMLRDKENKAMLNNSPANCRNFCSGYRYYGVQYTMECFCGNRIHFLLPKSSNECNANCSGNGGQKCGGTWRMNVYENENWE